MLSGAETQTRIEHNDGLARPRATTAPGWFDQQGAADLQRFEMLFPRLTPVLGWDSSNCDPAGSDVQAAAPDLGQRPSQPRTKYRFAQRQFRAISRNSCRLRRCVHEGRRRLAKQILENFSDRFLRFN